MAHIGRSQEADVYSLNVFGHKILAGRSTSSGKSGTESTEVTQAHAGTIAEVIDNLLLKSREHGLHIGNGDGTLLRDNGGKLLAIDRIRASQLSIILNGFVDGVFST